MGHTSFLEHLTNVWLLGTFFSCLQKIRMENVYSIHYGPSNMLLSCEIVKPLAATPTQDQDTGLSSACR
jgi:hypothetical protein